MTFSNLLKSYVNNWVALTADHKKVVASAKDLKQLDIKVKKANLKDVVYHYVLPFNRFYSP